MQVSLFIFVRCDDEVGRFASAEDLEVIKSMVADTPNLLEGLVYTPLEPIPDLPYSADGLPPPLALQLDFDDISALEAALAREGPLRNLTDWRKLPSLAGARVEHQAMLKRSFREAERSGCGSNAMTCTFLVAYPGEATDYADWLAYYLDSHTAILLRFPRLQALDVYTRIDWCCALPWARANDVQRNKVVFDGVQSLRDALASPVLQELRADVRRGPPIEGGSVHHAMTSDRIMPKRR